MVDWDSLMGRRTSVEQAGPLLTRAGADLDSFLQRAPQAEENVLAILAKRLGGGIATQTWGNVDASLAGYLGRDAASLIAWVSQSDQTARMGEVEKYAPPGAVVLLRTILGLYGRELQQAYERWRELPNDWVRVARKVLYDEIDKRYQVTVTIEKMNGEEFVVEASPSSFLRLLTALVRTATFVDSPDAFDAQAVAAFNDQVGKLSALLPKPKDVGAAS